jgi:hypothetical protein
MSRPSSGESRRPEGLSLGDNVKHTAVGYVDGHSSKLRNFDFRVEMHGKGRNILEGNALHFAVLHLRFHLH